MAYKICRTLWCYSLYAHTKADKRIYSFSSFRYFCDKDEKGKDSSHDTVQKHTLKKLEMQDKSSEEMLEKPNLSRKEAFPKPPRRMKQPKAEEDTSSSDDERIQGVDQNIIVAAKDIASRMGENKEKMENELIQGAALANQPDKIAESLENALGLDQGTEENIMSSIRDVASTVSGEPQSELAKKLLSLSHEKDISAEAPDKDNMQKLFSGLKIETRSFRSRLNKAGSVPDHQMQKESVTSSGVPQARVPRSGLLHRINIFDSPPLNIFKNESTGDEQAKASLWTKLQQKELRLMVEFAPTDGFEEMIRYTEQGKYWTFPIDNEIDMGKEETVGFQDHVFLERHLHGFPQKGPIRHFMHLVCVGLSKNPYVSAERKLENIEWFRQYFKQHEKLLNEAGALD